jgi:tRNA-specific 2-thiouridylase
VQGRENRALYSSRLTAVSLSWIAGSAPHCNWVYGGKTRYRQKDAPCTMSACDDERCTIDFAEAQWAVTPGQSVVVYESRVCLGGGIIETAQKESASPATTACPPGSVAPESES